MLTKLLVAVTLTAAAVPAFADQWGADPVGQYSGTCTTHYKDAPPGLCNVALTVDGGYGVYVRDLSGGCSPNVFTGILTLSGRGGTANLFAAGWAAQPRGQTLDLTFYRRGRTWTASGSGGGLSDRYYTYECSFRQN